MNSPDIYLSEDAVIAEAKITKYLLVPLAKDDKSKFLSRAGYRLRNWKQLEEDLRTQVLTQPARLVETTRYGNKYEIRTSIVGRNGVALDIITIWMVSDEVPRFVTLVPDR